MILWRRRRGNRRGRGGVDNYSMHILEDTSYYRTYNIYINRSTCMTGSIDVADFNRFRGGF